jgi:DNA-directed RNA polymerase subunit F
MSARSVVASLCTAVALGLALVACNEKAIPGGGDAGAHRTSDALTPEEAAKVLVKVGDKTITLGDYVAALEHMDAFDRMRYQSPERKKELLTEMINVELLAQEARAKGYDKDPQTQEDVRAVLRDAMLANARKAATPAAAIPESDVAAYYAAHKEDFHDPERRQLSVVVTTSEAAAKAVLAQATGAKGGLTAAQWGDLVKTKSVDPNAKANVPVDLAGDIGWVSPPQANGGSRGDNPRVPDAVREAAFSVAKPNDVVDHVVKVQAPPAPGEPAGPRYYVIRVTHIQPPVERTLAEADRAIRVRIAQDAVHAKEQELLTQLRAKFPVQIDDNALANVKVDLPDAGGRVWDGGAFDAAP